jgi:hypothetical protein
MENVTRDVIADLWPLFVSGEASPDTRALIGAFQREDPEFARMLQESAAGIPRHEVPSLPSLGGFMKVGNFTWEIDVVF